ncbi:39S ribosomal protein L40, mitochondrial [Cephus cinctus]|uniref:Large ribosomal subunit protein mL40 n=1 Tax=Cephus cinctus TaxID=211228 RepID=A0AAJ7BJL0_CEPCN|nr:39S ribosomal protein L40, mitochondrial [Cephus cinctus]
MSCSGILTAFSRLTIYNRSNPIRNISTNTIPVFFRITDSLLAEPLKKKKKLDPAIVKQREERKKRKLEKLIKRLEKHAKQLKPVDEMEIPLKLIDERKIRLRQISPLSPEVIDERVLLQKEWAKYKLNQNLANIQKLDYIMYSQQRALDELKAVSEDLYNEAIQLDIRMLPHTTTGPVRTPPIENYDSPDGDYTDITRKFEGET